ncbi:hypothetical protein, partial [Enterococcus termitis]
NENGTLTSTTLLDKNQYQYPLTPTPKYITRDQYIEDSGGVPDDRYGNYGFRMPWRAFNFTPTGFDFEFDFRTAPL